MRTFANAESIDLRRKVTFVGGVFFDGHVLVHVEVEMSCGILITNDYVHAYPRRILALLNEYRFTQRPCVTVRLTFRLHYCVITVLILRC